MIHEGETLRMPLKLLRHHKDIQLMICISINQGHAERGRTGRRPRASRTGAHPKSEISKITFY